MVNFVSVKTLSEIKLEGVTVDWVKEDKTVKEVIVRDTKGNQIQIKVGATYSDALKILVHQPFEEVNRFVLEGTFLGLSPVEEFFENEWEAKAKLEEYSGRAAYGSEVGLKVTPVKVRVDEDGKVVGRVE